MQIDWITFIAQIVNLLVLVWILNHFLYVPINNIIKKRKEEINTKIESANTLYHQAEEEFKTLELERNSFESSLQKKQNDMTKELSIERKKSLEKIKVELDQLKHRLQSEIQTQNSNFKTELESFISHDFINTAGKIITDLTDATPIERVLNLFYDKLVNLTKSEKNKIIKIVKNQKIIEIYSSNELTKKHQEDMVNFLRSYFEISPKTKINFQIIPSLILGVEIHIQNIGINWTVKNYLDELEQKLDNLLNYKK